MRPVLGSFTSQDLGMQEVAHSMGLTEDILMEGDMACRYMDKVKDTYKDGKAAILEVGTAGRHDYSQSGKRKRVITEWA